MLVYFSIILCRLQKDDEFDHPTLTVTDLEQNLASLEEKNDQIFDIIGEQITPNWGKIDRLLTLEVNLTFTIAIFPQLGVTLHPILLLCFQRTTFD